MGRSLHCQVEHHVRIKFATPILHAIENFKIYDIVSTYTQSLIVSFVYSFEIFSHLHFCSNCFSSILRHTSLKWYVLPKKTNHQVWLPFFTM